MGSASSVVKSALEGPLGFIPNPFGGHTSNGRKVDRKEVIKFLSQITTSSLLNQSTTCTSIVQAEQDMLIDCLPLAGQPASQFYEDNEACQSCVNDAIANVSAEWAQEREQWRQGRGVRVRMPYDEQIQALINDWEGCRVNCKACNFLQNSQSSVLKVSTDCKLSSEEQANWQNQIRARVTNELYSRNDILSALTKSVGESSRDLTAVNFSQQVAMNATQNIQNVILSNVNVNQSMNFLSTGGGGSLFVGASQSQFLTQGTQALINADFGGNLLSETQWKEFANIWMDNTTLDEVGNALEQVVTSFTGIINTVIGGVMFGLLVILVIVILVVVALAIIRARKLRKSQGLR